MVYCGGTLLWMAWMFGCFSKLLQTVSLKFSALKVGSAGSHSSFEDIVVTQIKIIRLIKLNIISIQLNLWFGCSQHKCPHVRRLVAGFCTGGPPTSLLHFAALHRCKKKSITGSKIAPREEQCHYLRCVFNYTV